MIERGKFRSLTLINWNGFFARTFELDELVTTLSGGNGAGKSTTMAAFVTALIPDLTLLHFRNTTEAGSTSGSRDKGLHGKLRPGVCYAVLDIINSRHQRIICAVRLQQIAGRDRKVDIKPFIIQGLPTCYSPTAILTDVVGERQARVLSLNEVKERIEANEEGTLLKLFNSIVDYHAQMFDLGVLSKRLRSSSDRNKYYKLIEASLYGGISSAITRSLREYLLPENSGVRKAFHDMEAALRENRMTLEAIKLTQSDRDLFKHLIAESTQYVASDYMRQANERRLLIDEALTFRRELNQCRQIQLADQTKQVALSSELQAYQLVQSDLETDYQAASDHLNLVQTAVRYQEKIERYQNDVDDLTEKVEEQNERVIEISEQLTEQEHNLQAAESEVDELKSQLADYQQALDVQQTRAIQYQQALQAQEKAKSLCQLTDLSIENVNDWLDVFQAKEQEVTEELLHLEQKISVTNAAIHQFEQAYQLVMKIERDVSRDQAWQMAKKILRHWPAQQYQAEKYHQLQNQYAELEQLHGTQQEAVLLLNHFNKRFGENVSPEKLDEIQQILEEKQENIVVTLSQVQEQHLIYRQELEQIRQQIKSLEVKAPMWLIAQDALHALNEQGNVVLKSSHDITEKMQQLLEYERKLVVERDALGQRKHYVEAQIVRFSQPSGAEDSRLLSLAERFGGVLLSEIYDDISVDDAAYFSASYGPSRHAIVVPDLAAIRHLIDTLEVNTPEDLYFIEGDPQSFDDNVFNIEELTGAVLIKTTDRQWRYSRFPEIPLFGHAARTNQLEILSAERETITEQYAKLSFDIQKNQRIHQNFSKFIGLYLGTVFEDNPEGQIQVLQDRQIELEQCIATSVQQNTQQKVTLEQIKEQLTLLNKLLLQRHLLVDETLTNRLEELKEALVVAQEAAVYVKRNQQLIGELDGCIAVLQADPEKNVHLQEQYQQTQSKQRLLKQQCFSLDEVVQRKAHFSYSDSSGMLTQSSQLSDKLRARLTQVEASRSTAREQFKQKQKQYAEYYQTQVSLKSAYESKYEMLQELQQEIRDIGVHVDANAVQRAEQRRDELMQQLNHNRQCCLQLEKQLLMLDNEAEQLQKKINKVSRDYQLARQQIVMSKVAWCNVMRVVKDNGIERRLYRRELIYMSGSELRSMSDKAMGALRLAVANNEHLRDVLRQSEDPKLPGRKVQFYLAVYQHLRERIRQDIVQTDDPIEAIEQMEIELSRLTEELTAREQQLAISAKSVASIIQKTIQREQNRIRMLNQGLQSVSFGQVNSVRLNVNIWETHTALLNALAQQTDEHQDLFTGNDYTFSEALAKLYQWLNPTIDIGQRTLQTFGEELLDYRNYLNLEVEVNRGTDGWLRAESGALSTGEAIGTGMSILVMVVQSWEDESKRLRGKDISPCRLLFLDEAARLDAKSIATLFELCERLEMQLIIAAPENISPEKGTTYKLIRKVFENQEHVHVVGLKGFAQTAKNGATYSVSAVDS